MQKRMYHFIGAATGWGAQIRTCEEGPTTLKNAAKNPEQWEILYPSVRFQDHNIPLKDALPLIHDLNKRLAGKVYDALRHNQFPVILGGDHSIAVGTWNGVVKFFHEKTQKPLGLIWIDAHMDAHTTETTPSGAWHGMPLAGLLGFGAPELSQLTEITPVLKPEHICMIGVRSFEEGEEKLLKKLGVKIYFMDEVKKLGFSHVLKEAIKHVSHNTAGYGVTLDVDAIDPKEAPGAGSAEPNGIPVQELLQGLTFLKNDSHLKAFELVEFNPSLDSENKTLNVCKQILSTVLDE